MQTTSDEETPADTVREATISLARTLLISALQLQTGRERAEAAKFARLMSDRPGQEFTLAVADEVFRSHDPRKQAHRFRQVLDALGVPRYPAFFDRLLIGVARMASTIVPQWVLPAVEERMRMDSARLILPGETEPLHHHLTRRAGKGYRTNLNHLGEAVLGEGEAMRRLEAILDHLDDPAVQYLSVKISAIFSQIHLLAWDASVDAIKKRLRILYRKAGSLGKFVNLDMEEYRDLALTVSAFREVLDEDEFQPLSAGIVLQAYLPDAYVAQKELTDWAMTRVRNGGGAIKIRIVKGANLAMEAVEAEMHGWHQAPYATKVETDANFRRMLEFGCQPEHAQAVQIGVGSHNLFDVALALTLREKLRVVEHVEIEMLEGMANHQARAVKNLAGTVLLYSPAVRRHDFVSAMAYLVRRLDENTSPENFLHDLFGMKPDDEAWRRQLQRFLEGWKLRETVSAESRRVSLAVRPSQSSRFLNEPDSDWTQSATREALRDAIKSWQSTPPPSPGDLDEILTRAQVAQRAWAETSTVTRRQILNAAADLLSTQRFTALAWLRSDGKKAIAEADGEVSEAIDFLRYYARHCEVPAEIRARPLGIVAVIPPWNFPYAIPCGGVAAALAAGNAVVLKPAPETIQTAWLLVRQLWEAGIPRDALQFHPCPDGEAGKALLTDSRVSGIVLTGSLETARLFQAWRPSVPLFAETSGKNSLLITAQSDRDLAIKDLVKSAFGHAGQKCSAASLGILEAEIYDDPDFRRQLRDAVSSLPCGAATDPRSMVTPVIREPGDALLRALTTLDEGEEWLLEPQCDCNDPCAWTPGIKLGVKPGSWFHRTECFGPVLGLMRARSLDEAIEFQNATDFGLTAGIHSLDPGEIAHWVEHASAGNLYVNRAITGAIVQRQPFGGWKQSCIGPGAKAGGPNYVFNFLHLEDAVDADPHAVEQSYREAWNSHFSTAHDPSALRAESNIFRYRSSPGVILRLQSADSATIERACLAARITGTPIAVSIATEESDETFATRLPDLARSFHRLRTMDCPADVVLKAASDAGLNWIQAPVTACGRIELRHWMLEQSVSKTLHRHGHIPRTHSAPAS